MRCEKGNILKENRLGNGILYALNESLDDTVQSELSFSGVETYMSLYRDQTSCWQYCKVGKGIKDVPDETQFMLVRKKDKRFAVLMPLASGTVRASLFSEGGLLYILLESGNPRVQMIKDSPVLYYEEGEDPYVLVQSAVQTLQKCLKTFQQKEKKKRVSVLNRLGWCTWNAFYDEISESKILTVAEEFYKHGQKLGFLLIDDGWQSSKPEASYRNNFNYVEDKYLSRLTSFEADAEKFPQGIAHTVQCLKNEFGVGAVLVWHLFAGYWCGVDGSCFADYPTETVDLIAEDRFENAPTDTFKVPFFAGFYPMHYAKNRMELVKERRRFYCDYYRYLKQSGVDGTKIDGITWNEIFNNRRGRAREMHEYIKDMNAAAEIFEGQTIYCSACSNDFYYNSEQADLVRTSTDFFPDQPETHGKHIFANACVNFFFGELFDVDWDMFQTSHDVAYFHAAARAISGGLIYIADPPAKTNFEMVRRVAHSDGTVPLAKTYAKLTKDSFFVSPENHQVLKIFNENEYSYVVGAFNCCYEKQPLTIAFDLSPSDIYGIQGKSFAVYRYRDQSIEIMRLTESRPFRVEQLDCEVFTIAPITEGFATIGLSRCFNGGASVKNVLRKAGEVSLDVCDDGEYIFYSERMPLQIRMGDELLSYVYAEKILRVQAPHKGKIFILLER